MTIQRDVYVLKDVLKTPIEITEGTDAVTLDFYVRDFNIPVTAAAVVYSIGPGMDEPNKMLADVDGNKISITPAASFFVPGRNTVQIRIISEAKRLITFQEIVKCKSKMKFPDEQEENQQTLVEQLLAAIGKESGNRKSADEAEAKERKEADRELDEKINKFRTISASELMTEFSCDVNVIEKSANGIVTLSVQMNNGAIGANAGTWWTAGTIPEGYRPTGQVFGTGLVCEPGWVNATPTVFRISDGFLWLYGQNSAATMLVINMTYAVEGSVVE